MPHADVTTVRPTEERLPPGEIDELVELLKGAERRRMFDALADCGELAFADLAEEVARRTATGQSADAPERHERVRCALVHNHLPRAADAGVVRVDRGRRTAALVEEGAKRELVDRLRAVVADASA